MSARTDTVLIPVIDGEVDETALIPRYLGEPLLPPPVGVATYTVRRGLPAPWAGLKFGGALACLVPLAYAIAESGAR